MADYHDVRVVYFEGHRQIEVRAGRKTTERIVPPAGDKYAFDRDTWPLNVTVSVSPTGRSTRLWIEGREVRTDIVNVLDRALLEARNVLPDLDDDQASAVEQFAALLLSRRR